MGAGRSGAEAGRGSEGSGGSDFAARRAAARERLDRLVGAAGQEPAARRTWFEQVYELANGDPAAVPWADLAAKPALVDWLERHPGAGRRALEVACGLGDNAEAIAAAGYRTTAFDLAAGAVRWAKARFPESAVDYRVADLFAPPDDWLAGFDLVHECYTIQALEGALRSRAFAAVAALVAPRGTLLVITRSRQEGAACSGPPWPLSPDELAAFESAGLDPRAVDPFIVERPGRTIPHLRIEYRKPR